MRTRTMEEVMNGSSPSEPVCQSGMKRRRVSKACHSCRSMKSKCDGKWPECDRCKGYGYRCVYGVGKRKHAAVEVRPQSGAVKGQSDLREAIRQYEDLLDAVLSKLSSANQRENANAVLARMKAADRALTEAEVCARPVKVSSTAATSDGSSPRASLLQADRFLGEVSDVRFFNLVKQVIQNQLGSADPNQSVDSYEQDGDIASPTSAPSRMVSFPSPEKSKIFTDVYFSTVHLAFPFIPQLPFMRSVEEARNSAEGAPLDNTRLALIYVIFAIGAYYTSLPGVQNEEDKMHEIYYLQALSLALPAASDRSIDHVCLLLAQCFYLLAVCRTDSCWVTLGQTVRIAQSIGLHLEQGDPTAIGRRRLLVERRRRVWSCIYVLDRLVSLQLGRPPAIHEDYCNVPLPSRLGDTDIDWDGDDIPADFNGPSTGDYHIALISFSDIISQVLRDLCSAQPTQDLAGELLKTKELDRQVLQWKSALPRTLRFDLGHAFEKSFVFKRQRSMFAIKYHHLRALIHRPYLCYPVLRNLDENTEVSFTQINWPLVNMYEKTCISEAREMARLLHSISSEKDLVEDFPWWQMISCLIFAGSILVVSSIFAQHTGNMGDGLDANSTCDDAETCLRVFEALSANSTGARIARDMMERLKEYGQKWRAAIAASGHQCHGTGAAEYKSDMTDATLPVYNASTALDTAEIVDHPVTTPNIFTSTPSAWPPEIVDSMAWSVQFFGAVQSKDQV